jgi:hypothetical protein
MTEWQDEQKEVATGVTDGAVPYRTLFPKDYILPVDRNDVLEEVAAEFDKMKVFGDTASSFAAYVRGMKR